MSRLPERLNARWRVLLLVVSCLFLEVLVHQYSYHVPRPSFPLDPPFQIGCRHPKTDAPRENATILMLTRNEDLEGAAASIRSLEKYFNRWFHYPVTFINNEPWTDEFKTEMSNIVSGEATFEVLPANMWGFPSWMNNQHKEAANNSMKEQGRQGIYKGGMESYHHMCRFYSGNFYDVEALKSYKWYWRIEPDVQFSCAITYDPFVEMAKRGKRYGYTVALWEVDNTVPSLFRAISDFKKYKRLKTTNLWRSMIEASWLPAPLRPFQSFLPWRDAAGDKWNLCHYWTNFEIADLDFFRGQEYRELFEYLDQKGGFYHERWGDASVHSLAAALLLEPHQLHHFSDFGYFHEPWRVCPANAPGKQLFKPSILGNEVNWTDEQEGGIGCRCECEPGRNFQSVCFNKLQRGTHPSPIVVPRL